MLDLDSFYQVALELTLKAGEIVKERIEEKKKVETKACDIDFVTETDKEVEKLLIDNLKITFPDHKFIGEESTAVSGQKWELTDEPTWIIDPVDGTLNFVHSLPLLAISVGLLINKDPVIGIIYNPILNQLFTAIKGQGSRLNGKPIKVSGEQEITNSLVCSEVGTSKDPAKIKVVLNNMASLVGKVHGMRIFGSACWALGLVASGKVDSFIHIGLHCWDLAAGWIIVREAGGELYRIRSFGSACMNFASVAASWTDCYFEFGLHAWDMAAGIVIVRESGGYVCDTTGGPLDIMNRRVIAASSESLAKQISEHLEQFELERD